MTRDVLAISGRVTAADAESMVSSVSREWEPRVRRKIYYPYFWLQLRYAARTFLGKTGMRASCLVDARTGLASTADPFSLEPMQGEHEDVMESRLDEEDALRIARRYLDYVSRTKRKALVIPKVEVLERALIYKPFWIVDCHQASRPGFSVLVDGITAGLYVLGRSTPALPPRGVPSCHGMRSRSDSSELWHRGPRPA